MFLLFSVVFTESLGKTPEASPKEEVFPTLPKNKLMMNTIKKVLFLIGVLGVSRPLLAIQEPVIGIIGDGMALGTGAHPSLTFDYQRLWEVMSANRSVYPQGEAALLAPFGISGLPLAPKVLWPNIREYRGEAEWIYTHLLGGFSRLFFNTPQYSWSYMVSRKLGANPEHIYIAADEGARVAHFSRQADRLLEALSGNLPPSVFAFFTMNDLCAPNMESVTSSENFGKGLYEGLIYLARNGKLPTQGTTVFVPHFLGLSQLLSKENILNHEVQAFGEKTSCRNLRARKFQPQSLAAQSAIPPEAVYLSAFLPQGMATKCPTLFDHAGLAQNRVGFFSLLNNQKRLQEISNRTVEFVSEISTRIRNYREHTDRAVTKANEWVKKQMPGQKLKFQAIKETAALDFEGADLSQDCFHFSPEGQAKTARAILQGLGQK